jgi:thiamine biosynthesis lipoprotein
MCGVFSIALIWGCRVTLCDGEVRAHGRKSGGAMWQVAVEQPRRGARDIAGHVALEDGALATSGDYRHVVEQDGHSFAHTMDPRRGRPATALLVSGPDLGQRLAAANCIDAMFAVDP